MAYEALSGLQLGLEETGGYVPSGSGRVHFFDTDRLLDAAQAKLVIIPGNRSGRGGDFSKAHRLAANMGRSSSPDESDEC